MLEVDLDIFYPFSFANRFGLPEIFPVAPLKADNPQHSANAQPFEHFLEGIERKATGSVNLPLFHGVQIFYRHNIRIGPSIPAVKLEKR